MVTHVINHNIKSITLIQKLFVSTDMFKSDFKLF